MEFEDMLDARRSVRSFTGAPVSRDQLDAILAAGVRAPNACNAQCWHFYCTIDQAAVADIAAEIYTRGEWLRKAGCLILICTDPEKLGGRFGDLVRERFSVQDTAAAATQMLQCATTLGLGGCWMGAFDRDGARRRFGVRDDMEPVILLGIGEPTALPDPRPRLPMDEVVTILGE